MYSNKIVVFQHLEKSGGSTLHTYLYNYFDENKTWSVNQHLFNRKPIEHSKTLTLSTFQKESILNANFVHDHHGILLTLNDPRLQRIAFFREPLSRLISHWNMICRHDKKIYDGYPAHIERGEIARSGFKNFLVAIKNQHPAMKHFNNYYAGYLLYLNPKLRKEYFENPLADPDKYKETLDRAIEQFSFVGLSEEYEFSLVMLDHYLHLAPHMELTKLNTRADNQSIPEFDAETLALAEELLILDRYIYQRITDVYQKQKATFMQSIPEGVALHSYIENNYKQHLLKQAPNTFLNIEMFNALTGTGLHTRERNGDKTWRWTGPNSKAHFDLILDRSKPLKLVLNITDYLSNQNISDLKIFVNNKQIKQLNFCRHRLSRKSITVICIIPKSYEQFTRITIDTGITTPAPLPDCRRLGIQIKNLIIIPYNGFHYSLNILFNKILRFLTK